jgi:hypothetical protein
MRLSIFPPLDFGGGFLFFMISTISFRKSGLYAHHDARCSFKVGLVDAEDKLNQPFFPNNNKLCWSGDKFALKKKGKRRPREAPERWCPKIWVFEGQKSSNLCPDIWVFKGTFGGSLS